MEIGHGLVNGMGWFVTGCGGVRYSFTSSHTGGPAIPMKSTTTAVTISQVRRLNCSDPRLPVLAARGGDELLGIGFLERTSWLTGFFQTAAYTPHDEYKAGKSGQNEQYKNCSMNT